MIQRHPSISQEIKSFRLAKLFNKSYMILLAAVLCIGLFATTAGAVNPILPDWEYVPDGEPYVFEDPDNPGEYRMYIYGSHDINVTNYCGTDQVVWSAPIDDLTDWRYDGVAFQYFDPITGDPDTLFAPDVAVVYGEDGSPTYYFYPNCQGNAADGTDRMVFVASSDRPDGPFEIINMVDEEAGIAEGVFGFDPAAFVDDDGRVYGYWGFNGSITGEVAGSHAAELDPSTMATILEGTEEVFPLMADDFFEASSIRKLYNEDGTDAIYLFIWSTLADGSKLNYAYGDSPLVPFTTGGTIVHNNNLTGGNNHGSIVEVDGQWFIVYHRKTSTSYARQAMAEAIDITIDWDARTVSIPTAENTSQGFEVDGLDPFQEYSAGIACYISGLNILRTDDRFDGVNNLYSAGNNSYAAYKYFNFEGGASNMEISMEMVPQGNDGTVYVRSGSSSGTVLASFTITSDMAKELTTFTAPISGSLSGQQAIYFTFSSSSTSTNVVDVYSFAFKQHDIQGIDFDVATTDYVVDGVSPITATTTDENTNITITQAAADNGNYAVVTFETNGVLSTYTVQMGTEDATAMAAAIAENEAVANNKFAIGSILIDGASIATTDDVASSLAGNVLTLSKGNTSQVSNVDVYAEKSYAQLTALMVEAEAYADADYTNASFAPLCYALWAAESLAGDDLTTEYISMCYDALETAIDNLEIPTVVQATVDAVIMTTTSYAITVSDSYGLTDLDFTAVLTGTTDVAVTDGATVTVLGDNSVAINFSGAVSGDGNVIVIDVLDGSATTLALESVACVGTADDGTSQVGRTYYTTEAVSFSSNADINGDGKVNLLDLTDLSQYLNITNQDASWSKAQPSDLNGDGVVDLTDAIAIHGQFYQ